MSARCTCEEFGNGVVRGQADPPAPAGRLLDEDCPVHGIDALIERSSLGSPEAKAIRAQTPRHVVEEIMDRIKALAEQSDSAAGSEKEEQ